MFIQYFIFDKTGNEVIEASALMCNTESEKADIVETMKNNFHSEPEFADTQLLISCGKQVLFNSKDDKIDA